MFIKKNIRFPIFHLFTCNPPFQWKNFVSKTRFHLLGFFISRSTRTHPQLPGVDLPFTLIFDYPSVASISASCLRSLERPSSDVFLFCKPS